MTLRHTLLLCAAFAACAACGSVAARQAAGCASDCTNEIEPTLLAAALVQPALLGGPNFRVIPEVQVRGYMARFLIDTPYGPLTADSADLLAVRVSEIPALEALDRASKTDAFAHALAERGRKTGAAVANVVAIASLGRSTNGPANLRAPSSGAVKGERSCGKYATG